MSHLHIPDGVLSVWWTVGGYALTIALLFFIGWRLRKTDYRRKVALLGIMSATMFVGMSCEFVPIAYHINLSVLVGIILGPALAFCAAFITELILALAGHGGITVVGLNTLVIGVEATAGWLCFRFAIRYLPKAIRKKIGLTTAVSTVLALFISTWLMIGVIAFSNVNPATARDTGSLNAATLNFENPLSAGVFANRIISPEQEAAQSEKPLDIKRFIQAVLLLGMLGWLVEGVITGGIINLLAKMRPDLILPEEEIQYIEVPTGLPLA